MRSSIQPVAPGGDAADYRRALRHHGHRLGNIRLFRVKFQNTVMRCLGMGKQIEVMALHNESRYSITRRTNLLPIRMTRQNIRKRCSIQRQLVLHPGFQHRYGHG